MYSCCLCKCNLVLLGFCEHCQIDNSYDLNSIADFNKPQKCKKCFYVNIWVTTPYCPSCNINVFAMRNYNRILYSYFDGINFYQNVTKNILLNNNKHISFEYFLDNKKLRIFTIDNDSTNLIFEKYNFTLTSVEQIKNLCHKHYRLLHYA